ncbi:MAG: acyl carrier protein [Candidatus Aminicenantales bacterium]
MAKDANEILAWVADIFESPVEKIRSETKREDIEAWDSLGIMTLMARLDEDFQVLLTDEEIQQMNSVADILDLLRKHGKLVDG